MNFRRAQTAGASGDIHGHITAADYHHPFAQFDFFARLTSLKKVQSQQYTRQISAGNGQTAALLRADGQINSFETLGFQVRLN